VSDRLNVNVYRHSVSAAKDDSQLTLSKWLACFRQVKSGSSMMPYTLAHNALSYW